MNNGFFGGTFDFDHDGILDPEERAMDLMAFTEMVGRESSSREEAIDRLACMGINVDDMSVTDMHAVLDDIDFSNS